MRMLVVGNASYDETDRSKKQTCCSCFCCLALGAGLNFAMLLLVRLACAVAVVSAAVSGRTGSCLNETKGC